MNLFDVRNLGQEFCVVLRIVLNPLFGEELLAHISSLIEFLGSQLNIDKVGLLEDLVHFIHLFSL